MSRASFGQIDIDLGGETITLQPTLAALQKIDRAFGSLREASERVANLSLDALVTIIAAGAGLDAQAAKALPERVFRAGILNLVGPVSEYLLVLMNPTGEQSREGAEGKG